MNVALRRPRRRGPHLRGPWPDRRQSLLLSAALGEDRQAIDAWRSFNQIATHDRIDSGSDRLLPTVYRNLLGLGLDGTELEPLKGIYERSWYRSQVLLHGGAQALRALGEAGVDTMVLKGAALGTCYYPDPGARPMDDFDVMVPFERAREAIAVLRAAGWEAYDPNPETATLRHHAEPFYAPNARELDLHWHLQWEAVDDTAMWAAALPITILGVTSRRLHPADQLLHVCVHGSSANLVAPIRWIVDALSIVRAQGDGLDWNRLIEQAAARRLTVTMLAALSYLRDELDAPVPAPVLHELRRQPVSASERWAHRARVTPTLPARKLAIVWERYSKLAALEPAKPGPAGFASFLQRLWGLQRRRELPAELVRRTWQHGFSSRH